MATELSEIVPNQKLGPVTFEAVGDVIRVLHQSSAPKKVDVRNTEAARLELISNTDQVLEFLSESNFDMRLASTITDMRARLESQQDIIQLGIAAISCQMVCDKFEGELPDIWNARLRAFSVTVGMYVAQFPDWTRFADNAAQAEYSASEVTKLFETGSKLVDQLRGAEANVDPEVPQTLAFLLEALRDRRRAVKRTVFAAIRSIENLVVIIIRSFGSVLSGIPEGMRAGVKSGVKIATASALLLIAAETAISVHPSAASILHTNWLGKAGKLIIESLKDAR